MRPIVDRIPLVPVESLHLDLIERLPFFKRHLQWFVENRADFADNVENQTGKDNNHALFLTVINRPRSRKALWYILKKQEFLSRQANDRYKNFTKILLADFRWIPAI